MRWMLTLILLPLFLIESGPRSLLDKYGSGSRPAGSENSRHTQTAGNESQSYGKAGEDLVEAFRSIGSVNSLLIEVGGEKRLEHYFGGMNENRATNMKSASKSILSLLVGIAIDREYLESTEQTINEFFPEYFESNPDSLKAAITIQDLLTMRSGLESTSLENYGKWVVSRNWTIYTLNQPMVDVPGGRMIYSTGSSHLLSVILTRATGMTTREFAQRYLFNPLGIQVGGWDRDPQGYYMGGNNLALSPLALLKIGRMVMDLGQFDGKRILPADWITESLQVYTHSSLNPYDYGYMWWRSNIGDYHVAFAWGYGGQYILMVPELDSVIAITSDPVRNDGSRKYQRQIFDWLEDLVVPYLENQAAIG
ncbi:MAG: serine hydrolase [Balneolaceae bacterium]